MTATTDTDSTTARLRQTAAYSTHGGRRYHATPACVALQGGQDFWDSDEGSGYPIRKETAQECANRGKTPCVVCKPPVVEVPLFGETFGHEPFEYDGVPICKRCWTVDGPFRRTVPWPCTSAAVLGLPAALNPAAVSS